MTNYYKRREEGKGGCWKGREWIRAEGSGAGEKKKRNGFFTRRSEKI